jgi:hypothetical protein
MAELVRHATQIADRAVVADIETEAVHMASLPGRPSWWDVRPMLDEREHSPLCIDMATQALQYALMRGLVVRHEEQAHLVRIVRHP